MQEIALSWEYHFFWFRQRKVLLWPIKLGLENKWANRNVKQMLVAGTKRGKIQFRFLFSLWLDQNQPVTTLVTAGTNEDRNAPWITKLQMLSSTGKWGTVLALVLDYFLVELSWHSIKIFGVLLRSFRSYLEQFAVDFVLCWFCFVLNSQWIDIDLQYLWRSWKHFLRQQHVQCFWWRVRGKQAGKATWQR